MIKDSLTLKDAYPKPQKISIHTPIGSIETGDDSPAIDVLIIVLVFSAFCIYVYARFIRKGGI